MLILDYRERGNLDQKLARYNVPTALSPLEFGDCMFEGHGQFGPALIGIERKRLDVGSQDLLNSMWDRRLSGHQLRGMRESYDYIYLVVEGLWREGPGGEIVVRRKVNGKTEWGPLYGYANGGKSVSFRQVNAYLDSLTLRVKSGIGEPLRIIQTCDAWQTASRYASLYLGFTEKEWHQHHSHDQLYCNVPKKGHRSKWGQMHMHGTGGGRVGAVPMDEEQHPNTLWRMSSQLPGVDQKARRLTTHFKTVQSMVLAGLDPILLDQVLQWFADHPDERIEAWTEIDGIGKTTAQAAVRAITEEDA
jgi:ERCC4-type nuclease